MKAKPKKKTRDATPLRIYVTEEQCPACGDGGMGACSRYLNCFTCGFRRELAPREIRLYTGLLLQRERESASRTVSSR